MATEGTGRGGASAEESVARIRELNDRIVDMSARAGQEYLEVYERTLESLVGFYEQAADAAGSAPFGGWASAVAEAQAQFTRGLAETYTEAGRQMLAAMERAAPRPAPETPADTPAAGAPAGEEPWPGYDDQTAEEVRQRLAGADERTRRLVREHERRTKNRASVLEAAEGG